MNFNLSAWPYAFGAPASNGKIRSCPEDFCVEESLSFEPSGSGEHAFLHIQKTGENTEFVARQLAKFAGVHNRDIGYAGLKDRHAVASQWFSVWLPGKGDLDWTKLTGDKLRILHIHRHARKLKRGALASNRFKIVVREWRGNRDKLLAQLNLIKLYGIPNYYGEQRFGFQGKNIQKALAMINGEKVKREQRSIYLSALRSFLFNEILGSRVSQQTWNKGIFGDTYQFDASKSCFKSEQPDTDILCRLELKAIHPTGALWGQGNPDVSAEALAVEQAVIQRYPEIADGLIAAGLKRDRRTMRISVDDLNWNLPNDNTVELNFSLPAGCYATALLREVIEIE